MNRYRGNVIADVEVNAAKLGVKVTYSSAIRPVGLNGEDWPNGPEERRAAILDALSEDAQRLLDAAFGGPRRRPTRRIACVETRRLVWRIMSSPGRGWTPSYPEIARMFGVRAHSTAIESVKLPVRRDLLPAWTAPLWRLAQKIGLTRGDQIPGKPPNPEASERASRGRLEAAARRAALQRLGPGGAGESTRERARTGDRFGAWTVIRQVRRRNQNQITYTCRCDCGNVREVAITNLEAGRSTRCQACSTEARKAALAAMSATGASGETKHV